MLAPPRHSLRRDVAFVDRIDGVEEARLADTDLGDQENIGLLNLEGLVWSIVLDFCSQLRKEPGQERFIRIMSWIRHSV